MRNRRYRVARSLRETISEMRVNARSELRSQRREDDRVRRLRRLSGSVRLTVDNTMGTGQVVHEFRLLTEIPSGVHNWPGHVIVELGETVSHTVVSPGNGLRQVYLAPSFAQQMVSDLARRGYETSVIEGLVFPDRI